MKSDGDKFYTKVRELDEILNLIVDNIFIQDLLLDQIFITISEI